MVSSSDYIPCNDWFEVDYKDNSWICNTLLSAIVAVVILGDGSDVSNVLG